MKFICSHTVWSRGINAVKNAVGSPISNPVVENIHVSAEKEKIIFQATNLNLTIRCEGEAKVDEIGQIVIPTKVIENIVRDLPQGDVIFEEDAGNIRMECGEFRAKLKGQAGDIFPIFMGINEGILISMDVKQLHDIIRKTIYATSTEKSRYELDGIKFDVKDKKMYCVATDGRRLAQFAVSDERLPDDPFSAMIPSKTLMEVTRSLPGEGAAEITIKERRIQFHCGDTTVISNLLKDNFPQYEKIIPPPGEHKILFKREELQSAVRRAANLANTETNMLLFRLEPGNLELYGERIEVGGEGRDRIKIEYSGENMEIRYNYRFLLDFLRAIDGEKVELEVGDPAKPGIFREDGNNQFLYVLMPMKSSDAK